MTAGIRGDLTNVNAGGIKRLAPDLAFQPQVYRADGESVALPPGDYTFEYTRGPEYRKKVQKVHVTSEPVSLTLLLVSVTV